MDRPYADWKDEALVEEFRSLAITVWVGGYLATAAFAEARAEILNRMQKPLAPKSGM